MPTQAIQNVLVLGATGSVGPAIIKALQRHSQKYTISILTRPASLERTRSMFPDQKIKIHTADYTSENLSTEVFKPAFEGQDAIVSATATFSVPQQIVIIDAAIANGVQRFIPSEYGVDTAASESLKKNLPLAYLKTDVVEYLKKHENVISWTAVCVGAFFDWVFQYPGLMGWNLAQRSAVIFDSGDVEYEASNIDQIGRAVANALSSESSPGFEDGTGKGQSIFELTKNKYIYVHSFATTQNNVLALLEEGVGEKFEVTHVNTKNWAVDALARTEKSIPGFKPGRNSDYPDGSTELITAANYGNGNLNAFGRNKGLWNHALSLPEESLDETIQRIVKDAGK